MDLLHDTTELRNLLQEIASDMHDINEVLESGL